MAEFYDHPHTGKLHFSAPAGGTGGGATSVFDAPATPDLIAAHPRDHARYIHAKRAAAEKAAAEEHKAHVIEEIAEHAKEVAAEVAGLDHSSNP